MKERRGFPKQSCQVKNLYQNYKLNLTAFVAKTTSGKNICTLTSSGKEKPYNSKLEDSGAAAAISLLLSVILF